MCPAGESPEPYGADAASTDAAFTALLEDSAEDLYESAPCGYLSTLMDGTIAKINTTLLGWLGLERRAVVGRMRFTDLLTVGGKLYHETHFAPLLQMKGEISGIALEMRKAGGGRIPVLVSSVVKHGSEGEPMLIRTTVFDASDRRSYEEELLRRKREAEQAHRQAETDRARLKEALAALQQSLLPATLPEVPGVETAVYYHTAAPDRLGGDFYDLFALDGSRWAFFLGDVCGKGPRAAAVTSLTRYTLRAAALHDPDPVTALTTLNTVLHERYTGGDPRYCTAIFGILTRDPDTGRVAVSLASGGHPPALVIRGDGETDFLPTPGGLLVGVLPQATFTPATTTLGPGDTLLLYTDGLTEARTGPDRADLYGDHALRDFVAAHAAASPHGIVKALTGLLEGLGDGVDDDTALLAIGVPGIGPAPRPAMDHSRGTP
ncbi:sigma-B regulation protein RsbU (phosphoserine phosphatase) [Streptomyces sp. B4I13]|uniref:PP2C family protein-serine/threonine phosphatase n=1 Tax=Streptomyces sp. B4I13 TaxID=3042271 RepID=UPI0027896186|nr:SpoIIE family protein phosphatase [Streptomyces sp. B4I13]MDQ0956713.1 sigma-B regulation protein RsbU (phosphoserine phosphatase) [Streptomyces sp. B4I13]